MLLFLGIIFLAVTLYFGREIARASHDIGQLKANGAYEAREALWFKLQGLRCLASISMLLAIWCMAWALLPTTMHQSWDFAMMIMDRLQR